MNILKTQMDNNGRILIPAELRKQYNMSPGDSFVLEADNDSIKVLNTDAAIEQMHAIFFKHKPKTDKSVVDDFLAQRREEYDLEQKKYDRLMKGR